MPELTYFDVHAQFGARPQKMFAERWSLAPFVLRFPFWQPR